MILKQIYWLFQQNQTDAINIIIILISLCLHIQVPANFILHSLLMDLFSNLITCTKNQQLFDEHLT